MPDQEKTKAQLIRELEHLRRRVTALEAMEAAYSQLEAELHHSQALLRSVVDSVPDRIMTVGPDRKILYLNRPVPERDPEPVIGSNVCDYISPESQAAAAACLDRVFETGRPDRYESTGRGSEGEMAFYEWRAAPIKVDGRVTAVTLIVTDISRYKRLEASLRRANDELERGVAERTISLVEINETLRQEIARRRQAEEALRQSEARYRIVTDLTSDYAYAYRIEEDGVLTLEWASDAFTRLTGFSPAEIESPNGWRKIVHPEDLLQGQTQWQMLLANRPVAGEIRLITKKGAVRWTRHYARPVWDAGQGRVTRVYGAAQDITGQKEVELALAWREKQFRAMIENASDIITVLDEEGVITYQSPAGERLLGYPAAELTGRKAFDFIHPEDLPGVKAAFQTILRTSETIPPLEFRFRRRDQAWGVFEATGHQLPPDLAMAGVVVNSRDVTERKQMETALRASETRFRTIWQVATDAMALSDPAGVVLEANPAYFELYGYPPEEIIGRSFAVIFPEPDRAGAVAQYRAVFAAGDSKSLFETVVRRVDGTERIVESKIDFLYEDGRRTAMLSIIRDVTTRKQAEETFHKNRQLLQGIIDNVAALIFVKDPAGRYLLVNKHHEQIFQIDRRELVGQGMDTIFPETVVETLRANDDQVLEAGAAKQFEEIIPQGDSLHTYLSIKFPLFDAAGRIYAVAGMATDITNRKRIEKALETMNQRYRTLFDEAPAMYVVTRDRAGEPIIADANEQFLTKLGYDWTRVYRRPLADFYTSSSQAKLQTGYQRVMTGSFITEERDLVAGTGQTLRTLLHASPEIDASGRIIGTRAMYIDITERKQLQDRLVAIYDLGRDLTLLHDETMIVRRVLETADLALRCGYTSCGLCDETTKALVYRYHLVEGDLETIEVRLAIEESDHRGIAAAVVRTAQALNIPDVRRDPRYVAVEKGWASGAKLCVPMKVGDRVIGVLNAESKQVDHFTPDDQRVLQILADQAAVALENAWLHEESERHVAELAALNKAGRIMASSLEPAAVLEQALAEIKGLLQAEGASILLHEPPGGELVFAAAAGQGAKTVTGMRLPAATGIAGWVFEHNRPLLLEDVQQDSRFYSAVDAATGLTTRALIAAPLPAGENVIGVIEAVNKVGGRFNRHDLELLQTLAGSAAIAVENARLYAETQARLEAQLALRRASAAMFSTLELEVVLTHMAEQMGRTVGAARAYICGYEADRDHFTVLAEYINPHSRSGEPEAALGQPYYLNDDHLEIIKMLQAGEPSVAHWNEPPRTADGRHYARQFGARSILTIPLKMRGQLVAYAEIWENRRRREFTAQETALCQDIARQAVIAMENARLHAETERRANQLSVLHELDQAVTASLNLPEVYEAFTRHAIRLVPYNRTSIVLREGDYLRIDFVVDEDDSDALKAGTLLPLSESTIGRAIVGGKAVTCPDIRADHRFNQANRLVAKNIRSVLLLPLRSKGQVIGTWNMGSYRKNAYDQDALQIAQSMADQLAIALENIHLFEAEKVQRRRTQALQAAGAAVSSTLDLNQVLDRLLVELGRVVAYDSASVFLLEEKQLRITVARSLPDPTPIGRRFEPNDLVKLVQQTRQPLILADASSDPRFQRWKGARHVRGWMSIPLLARDAFIGHITLDSRQAAAFTQTDAALALSFANQAAMAVENARLYQNLQKQMQVLEEIQAQLVQSEKMAALGRLSAAIAHEINNPLQAIQSGLLLFKEKAAHDLLDEKLNQYLEIAEQEIDRISAIMRRMRNFYPTVAKTQPAAGPSLALLNDFYRSSSQEWRRIDLQEVLESEIRLLEKHLQQKAVTVNCRWPARRVQIQGNADHLRQVFLNVIINAAEAMSDRGGDLHLSLTPEQSRLADGQTTPAVRIEISDTGPGIPPAELQRLFEPFYTGKEKGSGLGLFISYKIIEAHQGRISVESRVGLGTTFSIWLPREQSGMNILPGQENL